MSSLFHKKKPINGLPLSLKNVKAQAPLDKVLFEFQAVNWRTQKPIPESELIDWMKLLQKKSYL